MPAEKKKRPNDKPTKLYSRDRFKKTVESELDGKKISQDTDILMYMNFMIFLERLAKQSEKSADERASNRVTTNDIGRSLKDTLREFRG